MITNPEIIRAFEDRLLLYSKVLPAETAMRLFEGMWKEAITLGIFPQKNPLEGIEIDIALAKTLNSCSKNCSHD